MTIRPLVTLVVGACVVGVLVAALALSQPARPGPGGGLSSPPTLVAADSPVPMPTAYVASSAPSAFSSTSLSPASWPPSPTRTLETCCLTLPTPVPGEMLAESDAFWNYWSDFPYDGPSFKADSLEENVGLAHLVIRGHITDLYIGEDWQLSEEVGTVQLGYVRVAISEVLKGNPVSRDPGFVEVYLGRVSPETVDDLRESLPQHENVWFLMHDVTVRPRTPPNDSEIAPFAYFPSNDLQGVLRNIDGEVKIIKPAWTAEIPAMGPSHFPLTLQDTSFEELVQQVREIAETAPEVTPITTP